MGVIVGGRLESAYAWKIRWHEARVYAGLSTDGAAAAWVWSGRGKMGRTAGRKTTTTTTTTTETALLNFLFMAGRWTFELDLIRRSG